MGFCRNAVAQKLRSGFEPGKRLDRPVAMLTLMGQLSHSQVT